MATTVYGNETTTMLPNQPKFIQALRCEVCKIDVNSKDSYEKHAAQVCLMSNGGIGPSIAEFQRIGVPPFQEAAKKIKVAQSAWCETCKVNCNSRDMYITHLAGKKHLKSLEKLSNPKIDVGTSSTANASNTLIGPQEKPGTDNPKAKKASISLHLTSPAQIRLSFPWPYPC
ncbi:hypothetical protein RYX36_008274 [Vicia faba]